MSLSVRFESYIAPCNDSLGKEDGIPLNREVDLICSSVKGIGDSAII